MLDRDKEKEMIYNFLKEKGLIRFSVQDATDMFWDNGHNLETKRKTYQYAYRCLHRLESEGWLISSGEKRKKRFSIATNKQKLVINYNQGSKKQNETDELRDQLKQERSRSEAELAIILAEIDEYTNLIEKNPIAFNQVQPLLITAREESVRLLGKVNALSNVLSATSNQGAGLC